MTSDPTLWLSRVKQLLELPVDEWMIGERQAAVELLAAGVALLKCKAELPRADVQAKLVERAQCLAACAEDLAREIVRAVPSS